MRQRTPEASLDLWLGDFFIEDGGPRDPDSERIRRLVGAMRDGVEMPFDIAPDGTIIWKLWAAALFQTKPAAPCYTVEGLAIHNAEAAYEALENFPSEQTAADCRDEALTTPGSRSMERGAVEAHFSYPAHHGPRVARTKIAGRQSRFVR